MLSIACTVWIWFAPEADFSRIKRDGDLTTKGWIALMCGLGCSTWLLPHVFHIITRKPAIEVGDGKLNIWMFPYESIPLAEISRIEVADGKVTVLRHGKKPRKLNTAVTEQPRAFFFDDVATQLGSRQLVQEK